MTAYMEDRGRRKSPSRLKCLNNGPACTGKRSLRRSTIPATSLMSSNKAVAVDRARNGRVDTKKPCSRPENCTPLSAEGRVVGGPNKPLLTL